MEFEKAYQKYREGTASEEEKAFVESEIERIRKVSSVIDEKPLRNVVEKAEADEVKKAKKKYTLKTTLITLLIVAAVIIVIAAAVCGGIFGTAVTAAKQNLNVSVTEAERIATLQALDIAGTENAKIIISSIEKEIVYTSQLKNSRYIYEVEAVIILDGLKRTELEIEINADTGIARITDVDNG